MSVDRPQGLVEGSGRRLEPRRLDQMISVRLDPTIVAALRQVAGQRGMSLSETVREAALLLLEHEKAQNVIKFRVDVTNGRTGATGRESFSRNIEVAI